MNKKEFLKTELGKGLYGCVVMWDKALEMQYLNYYDSKEYKDGMQAALWCQAQWEVYQIALKQFCGVEFHFNRTDECYGVCTEDGDWLIKINRKVRE